MSRPFIVGLLAAILAAPAMPLAISSPVAAIEIDASNIEGPCVYREATAACTPQGSSTPTQSSIVESETIALRQYSYAEPGNIDCGLGCDAAGGIFRVSGVVDRIEDCAYSPRGSHLIPDGWDSDFADGSWDGRTELDNGLVVQLLGVSANLVGGTLTGNNLAVSPNFFRVQTPPGSAGKYVCAMSGAFLYVDQVGPGAGLDQTSVSSPRVIPITPIAGELRPYVFLQPTTPEFGYGSTYRVITGIGNPLRERIGGDLLHRTLSVGFADELDADGTATCEFESNFDLISNAETETDWISAIGRRSDAGRYLCAQHYVSYLSPEYGFVERWSPIRHVYVEETPASAANVDLSQFDAQSVLEILSSMEDSECVASLLVCSIEQFSEIVLVLGDLEEKSAGAFNDSKDKGAQDSKQQSATQQEIADRLSALRTKIEMSGVLDRFGKAVNWSPSAQIELAKASKFNPVKTPLRRQGATDANGLSLQMLVPGAAKAGKNVDVVLNVGGKNNTGTAQVLVFAVTKKGPKLVEAESLKVKGGSGKVRISGKSLGSQAKATDYLVLSTFQPADRAATGVAAASALRVSR